jgi:DNA/RNA endonuclease YhcR with UshA esterase domain
MKPSSLAALLSGLVLLAASPLSAHHSVVAYYDTNTEVTLKGEVTKIEWTNPHAFVYLDVKSDRGTVTSWAVETDSPNVLSRAGWTKTTIHPGDIITVSGYPAKKQSGGLRLVTLTLADGRKLKG